MDLLPTGQPLLIDDAELNALRRHPFAIYRPSTPALPFVFAVPHAGRIYPACFQRSSRLSPVQLRQSEDAFIDDLFSFVVPAGAPLIAARFPRAFVDVNRSPRGLDPAMFSGPLGLSVESAGSHVAMGLGVIPRVVREGLDIYDRKLAPEDAAARLARFYQPYHEALCGLIAEIVARFGIAILIDCHSMPSGDKIPDIVIGDRFGVSAMPSLTHLTECAFSHQGFRIARNAPYAGGYTTQLYGRRNGPVQALQIEINRALYMDETRIERSSGYADTQRQVAQATNQLLSADYTRFFASENFAFAAE